MTAPMANMVIAMTDIDSRATPDAALAAVGIAAATARNVKVFNLYIVVLIVTAFKKAGIELQFLRWYPNTDKTPELVIGSKPNP